MPKLWVFRRVPELRNRTGFIYVADDALADKLIAKGAASRDIDWTKPVERAPRPGAAITPTDQRPPPEVAIDPGGKGPQPKPAPDPVDDDGTPRRKKRKAADE